MANRQSLHRRRTSLYSDGQIDWETDRKQTHWPLTTCDVWHLLEQLHKWTNWQTDRKTRATASGQTDKLQRVLNAAARVVTGTWSLTAAWVIYCRTFPAGCYSSYQWEFTGVWTLNSCAQPYLSDHCVPTAGADTRRSVLSRDLLGENFTQEFFGHACREASNARR